MRVLMVFGIVASTWLAAVSRPVGAEQQGSSTWSGVYTEEQAKLGQSTYTKACAECHGQDLGGDGFAPGLKGTDFMTNWNGLTVGDLFDRIRISMPPDNPTSVSSKEKADIVAYILKENAFPAGTSALPSELAALKAIKFEANKPGR